MTPLPLLGMEERQTPGRATWGFIINLKTELLFNVSENKSKPKLPSQLGFDMRTSYSMPPQMALSGPSLTRKQHYGGHSSGLTALLVRQQHTDRRPKAQSRSPALLGLDILIACLGQDHVWSEPRVAMGRSWEVPEAEEQETRTALGDRLVGPGLAA